jgi:alpha-N-arabinofuranosidase
MLSAALPAIVLSTALSAQPEPVNATIDVSKTGAPISKNIYGQFLEHGGDIVNTGIWSEMLVDRKFFYPVAAGAPTPPPVMGNAGGNPRFNRKPTRWWVPVGGEGVITMDSNSPYSGDHSPLIKLEAREPHGLSQSGIAVRKGKAYTGRIVLSGSAGAEVKVTLIWARNRAIAKAPRSMPSARGTVSFRCGSLSGAIPTMRRWRSPERAPARFMSAQFHSCRRPI